MEQLTTVDVKFIENDVGHTCFSALASALHYIQEIYIANKVQLIGNKIKKRPTLEVIDGIIKNINEIQVKGKRVGMGIKLPTRHTLNGNIDELCVTTHYIIMIVLWSNSKSCKRVITLIDDIIFDPLQSQGMKRTQKTLMWLLNDGWNFLCIYSFHHGAKERNSNIHWM